MDFKEFKNGMQFSLGAELELRLLNKDNFTLANEYEYIYENIDDKYKKNISPEFLNSIVEINSPVFQTGYELKEFFIECLENIKQIADNKSLLLSATGAYCLKNENIEINKNPRYKEILDEHQILLRDFNICGFHVHIGFKDFNQALQAYNFSIKYLPVFLALSSSSAFFNGENSGLHSYRQTIFDRLPKAGIPEYFDSYIQMKNLYDLLEKTEVIEKQKDVWWDIRIQPDIQTLEFRICDSMNDLNRIEIIVSLIQSLCKLSTVSKVEKLPRQILKQNIWSAARHSLDGYFISNENKKTIKEVILDLTEEFLKEKFIDENFQKRVVELLNEDTISQKMINMYKKTNSIIEVEKLGVIK